jgi:hypothetical protein
MVRTSTPAQDRQALLMKGILATLAGEIRAIVRERAGRARRYTETPLKRTMTGAVQQADEADEGRSEASGSTMLGKTIVNVGKVVRPSQLIRSVRRTD